MVSPILASATAEPAAPRAAEGDRWGEVAGELWSRPLVRAALVLLLLVHGLAIGAPLIAGDRPYYLHASEPGAYRAAHRMLPALVQGLREAVGPAEAVERAPWAATVLAESRALELRLEVLARNLPPEGREPLAALQGALDGLRAAARVPVVQGAREALEAVEAAARAVSVELGPDAVELVPRRTWPLLAALGAAEVFFVVLWILAAASRLWARPLLRRFRRAAPERGRRVLALVLLGVPLASALAWQAAVPARQSLVPGNVKLALASGALAPVRVVFPPLALGFAETHLEEGFRPPTWTRRARVDARGRYEHGGAADLAAGLEPERVPVDVRPGEPGRNSPWRHPLGTDQLGRDMLVRLLWGGRVTLAVGLVAALLTTALGTALGALAGFAGGKTDFALSRLMEVMLAIPALYLILLAAAVTDPARVPPILTIVALIALVAWTGVARLVRAEILRLRELEFVLAARALGLSRLRIVLRHLLPNALAPVLVAFTFAVAGGMLIESVVSFLGFGIQHPVPSWGSLINASRSAEHWWVQVFPGLALFVTVTCYHLVGEGLRDALDPRGHRSLS